MVEEIAKLNFNPANPDPRLLLKIDELPLSKRVMNALTKAKRTTPLIYVVDAIQKTEAELLRFRGFGDYGFCELMAVFNRLGLNLNTEVAGLAEDFASEIERIRMLPEADGLALELSFKLKASRDGVYKPQAPAPKSTMGSTNVDFEIARELLVRSGLNEHGIKNLCDSLELRTNVVTLLDTYRKVEKAVTTAGVDKLIEERTSVLAAMRLLDLNKG